MEGPKESRLEELIGNTIPQEEYREYNLSGWQYERIRRYFVDLVFIGQVAVIDHNIYFCSDESFCGYAVAKLRDDKLSFWGNSESLGKLRKDIEEEIGAKLAEKLIKKALTDEEQNMGFPIP